MPLTTPRLRYLRDCKPLSIRELAARSNVSVKTIVRLEQGHGATPKTIRRLASTLGCEPEYLMGGVAGPVSQELRSPTRAELLARLKSVEAELRTMGIKTPRDDDY